jgi:hypothetical protein
MNSYCNPKVIEFSEDELCSDSFPMKLVDNLVYEFKGKHVVRKEGEIVLGGANASQEGEDADEGSDEHVSRLFLLAVGGTFSSQSSYVGVPK